MTIKFVQNMETAGTDVSQSQNFKSTNIQFHPLHSNLDYSPITFFVLMEIHFSAHYLSETFQRSQQLTVDSL